MNSTKPPCFKSKIHLSIFFFRNLLKNGLWPASIWNLGVLVVVLSMCMLGDWDLVRPINVRLFLAYQYIPEGISDHKTLWRSQVC
jgi:hypothetical protein